MKILNISFAYFMQVPLRHDWSQKYIIRNETLRTTRNYCPDVDTSRTTSICDHLSSSRNFIQRRAI